MRTRAARIELERALPVAGGLLAVATVAVGLALTAGGRVTLGTPLPPFLFSWSPLLRWPAGLMTVQPPAPSGRTSRALGGMTNLLIS